MRRERRLRQPVDLLALQLLLLPQPLQAVYTSGTLPLVLDPFFGRRYFGRLLIPHLQMNATLNTRKSIKLNQLHFKDHITKLMESNGDTSQMDSFIDGWNMNLPPVARHPSPVPPSL